jgi:hypothetical protein
MGRHGTSKQVIASALVLAAVLLIALKLFGRYCYGC